VGGEVAVAPAGSYVLKPRGLAHAFYNAGAQTVRVLEVLRPGGFDGYFVEYEKIASKLRPRHKVCDTCVYLAWQKQ
jgi:uncharacterized cupin superfamily protein